MQRRIVWIGQAYQKHCGCRRYRTGPSFLGLIFNVFLCGITAMQTSVYYSVYKQ